jgi:O-6-methylguanine DNA methyltransferase
MKKLETLPKYYKKIKSPVGPLTLVSDGEFLLEVRFGGGDGSQKKIESDRRFSLSKAKPKVNSFAKNFFIQANKSCAVLEETETQLAEYFNGERESFDLPIRLVGTGFQLKVWRTLQTLKFGKTCSYQSIALKIKNPKAVRAVGGTIGKNPLGIIIPCHRVIGKSGKLTGFAGGLHAKKLLLANEQISDLT